MTSSIVPSHQYHPPRHPHAISPTTPSTPPPFATGYYPSSTSTLPRTTSYRSTGPPSTSSASSSPSPRLNPGLVAARHVTKAASRLHKRSRSDNKKTSEEQLAFDDIVDEGFFSGPGSPPLDTIYPHHSSTTVHRARGKIKPLLKKVSGSSRGNSLDLSRSDGGLPGGVGLGIFDNTGDSSGVDDESPFSNRHRRNFSGTSGNSPLLVNAPFAHPKRQLPRRGGYTPEVSHYNTSNESSDDSDDDESVTRRTVLQGSSRSIRGGLHLNTGRSTPMLPTGSMTDLHQRRASGSTLTTPVSPTSVVDFPVRTFESAITHNPSPTGSRAPSFRRSRIGRSSSETTRHVRDPSPTYGASIVAARLAWEAKQEKKEEKRERKRRRSEAKGEERSRATSRCSGRGRGNSGGSNMTNGTVWDDDLANQLPEKVPEEDCAEGRGMSGNQGRGKHGTGPKWGLGGKKERRPAFKRWLEFVVWIQIGVVRIRRKLRL